MRESSFAFMCFWEVSIKTSSCSSKRHILPSGLREMATLAGTIFKDIEIGSQASPPKQVAK